LVRQLTFEILYLVELSVLLGKKNYHFPMKLLDYKVLYQKLPILKKIQYETYY